MTRRGGGRFAVSLATVIGAAVALAACSPDETDFRDAAVDVIEGDIAEQLGVEDLGAECAEPEDDAVGTTFTCTADLSGSEARFTAEIVGDDRVDVQSTNLLVPEDMPEVERSAAEALTESVGTQLNPEQIDCGDGAFVVAPDAELVCAFTSAEGDVYDATVTWRGDAATDGFDVQIAETPR